MIESSDFKWREGIDTPTRRRKIAIKVLLLRQSLQELQERFVLEDNQRKFPARDDGPRAGVDRIQISLF